VWCCQLCLLTSNIWKYFSDLVPHGISVLLQVSWNITSSSIFSVLFALWLDICSKTHLPPTHDWIHSRNDDLPTVEVNVIFHILGEIGFTSLLSCLRLSFSRSTVSIYVLYKRQQEAVEICSRSPPPRTPADGHWCPMIAPTRTHTSRWTLMPNDSTSKNPHLDFALI